MADTNPPRQRVAPPSYVGAPVPLGELPREEPTNPGVKLERLDAAEKKRKRRKPWYIMLASVLVGGGGTTSIVGMLRGTDAKDTVETRTTKLEVKVDGLQGQFNRFEVKHDEDSRAIYQAIMSKGTKRTPRLEKPAPIIDSGTPLQESKDAQ